MMAVTSNLSHEYHSSDIYIKISVGNPILHYTWENGQFTSYAINIETNSPSFSVSKSTVRRRYSEFVQFRKMLKSQHPAIQPPPLPSRSLFKNRFKPDFIEERSQGLENFLQRIFATSLYLSNKTVHLFTQTKLSMDEISAIVIGGNINVKDTKSMKKLERLDIKSSMHSSFAKLDDDDSGGDDCQAMLEDVTNHCSVSHNPRITHCTPSLHALKVSDDESDDPSIIHSYTPPLTNSSSSNQNSPILSEISSKFEKPDEITLASLCEIPVNSEESCNNHNKKVSFFEEVK